METNKAKEPVNMDSSKRVGHCPSCNTQVWPEEHRFCPNCGQKFIWPTPKFSENGEKNNEKE